MTKAVFRGRAGSRVLESSKASREVTLNGQVVNRSGVRLRQNGHGQKANRQKGFAVVTEVSGLKSDTNLAPVVLKGDELANGRRLNAMVQRDGQLICRCLAGDVSAWSEIYREFHDSLLVSIRRYLNRAGQDTNLVEEIAARVWYALIKNGFELLAKFDVSRGCRLSTYLSVVAKNETRVLFRSERRRRSREQLASRPDISDQNLIESHLLVADNDFLVTLSQAERAYFLDVLVASPTERDVAEQNYSTENNWQLRHRIRKKLQLYISESDE